MAQWQFKIKIDDSNGETVPEVAAQAVSEINRILPLIKHRAEVAGSISQKHLSSNVRVNVYKEMAEDLEQNILPLFEEIVKEEIEDSDTFDSALEDLYDWGDTALDDQWNGRKMCWVKHTFRNIANMVNSTRK